MKISAKLITIIFFGIISAFGVTYSLAFMEKNGILVDSFYEQTIDWRTLFFSKRIDSQRDDIAVILVTEDSLYKYPSRSPVDRVLLSKLIKEIEEAGASAIGVDFIFDRPTYPDKDQKLINTVRNAKVPVIIGQIDGRSQLVRKEALDYQKKFLKEANVPSGHIYFARSHNFLDFGDGVVRKVPPVSPKSEYGQSFARKVAEFDGKKSDRPTEHIAWVTHNEVNSLKPFSVFEVPVHKPSPEDASADQIFPLSWRSALKNKIILIGGDFIDRDRHYTPLSVYNRVRVPGVMIHAQIIAQLRDGRFIYEFSDFQKKLGMFLLTFLGFTLGWFYKLGKYEIFIGIIGVTFLIVVGALAFWWFKYLVPSSLLIAWAAGGTLGHFFEGIYRKRSSTVLQKQEASS